MVPDRLQFAEKVRELYPFIPDNVLRSVADREAKRVQNMRLDVFSYAALALAAVAGYIRHNLTQYDYLLTTGKFTRFTAQERVRRDVQRFVRQWRGAAV